jgi:hypothetical protein
MLASRPILVMALLAAVAACASTSQHAGPNGSVSVATTNAPPTTVAVDRAASVDGQTVTVTEPDQVTAITVPVGGQVHLTLQAAPGARRSDGSPVTWPYPISSNPAVLADAPPPPCASAITCGWFEGKSPGSATISGSGPSGIICNEGDCVGVAAALYRIAVTVVASGTASFS